MNLIHRATQFKDGAKTLIEWLGAGAVVVDREVAQKRADICVQCPMNKNDSIITSSIAAAIKKQLEIKSKMDLRVMGEKSLHTCSACGCVNRLKIHIPLKNILPDEKEMDSFDAKCWLRNETP